MNDIPFTQEALSGLRDDALLLVLANKYLCDEQFLKKIGSDIDQNVQNLRADIISLKREFPGKFVSDIDTDGILKEIRGKAHLMRGFSQKILDKCVMGELGREFENDIRAVSHAIELIKHKVEGKGVKYTTKDSVSNIFSVIKSIGFIMGRTLSLSIKIISFLLLIAVSVGIYLYLTMEKEGDFLKEIATSETYIHSQENLLDQIQNKKKQLTEKLASLEKQDQATQNRIEIMGLELEIRKANEEIQKAKAEINGHEEKIRTNEQKIDEMKKRSFLKRLLRQ